MKTLIASALLTALPGGVALSTQYQTERALRVEVATELKIETTTMEIERDGERVDGPGGGSSHTLRKETHLDQVLAVEDGMPTKVRRTFESIGGRSEVSF
jgi:hypothetical protein